MKKVAFSSGFFVGPCLAGSLLCSAAAYAADGESAQKRPDGTPLEVTDEASRLWFEGMRAFKESDFVGAAIAFEHAYTLKPTSSTLLNLAVSQLNAGDLVRGARHLSKFLRTALDTTDSERADVARQLALVEKEVGRLTFQVAPPGAAVEVDGWELGKAPIDYAWHVSPGAHTVRVNASGLETREEVVHVQAGAVVGVPIALEAPRPAALGVPPVAKVRGASNQPTPVREKRSQTSTVLLVSGGAATIVSGIAWFALARSAVNAQDDAAEALAQSSRSSGQAAPCQAPTSNAAVDACAAIADHWEDSKRLTRWRNVAAMATVSLGTITLAGAIYDFVRRRETARPETLRVGVWSAPSAGGLTLHGRF